MPLGSGAKDTGPQPARETGGLQQIGHADDRKCPSLGTGDHKVELQRNSALRASATRNAPRGGRSLASLLQSFIAPGGPPPTVNPRISP